MKPSAQYDEWEYVPSNTKPKHKNQHRSKQRESKRQYEEED
jgi:hypothetical protein